MNDEIKENLSEMLFNRDERLYNYITNLQQKYNEANNAINWWSNKAKELQQENEILRKNAEHNDKVVDKARWNEMIYKSRCEKAIDKLYCYGEVFDSKILQQFQKEMENILHNGDDKDD